MHLAVLIFLQDKFDRVYNVNGKQFQLKKTIVDRLLYYNKSPASKNNQNVDKTFVELLLMSMFHVKNLKQNIIDRELLNIVKRKKNNFLVTIRYSNETYQFIAIFTHCRHLQDSCWP